MKTLRPIQVQKSEEAHKILKDKGLVYIAGEVRSGKSATSLEVCYKYGAACVIFLTKKKAISSIEEDYADFGYDKHFDLIVINDESMHKIDKVWVNRADIVIHDESHRFGAYPKPGKHTKTYKSMFYNKPQIFLSGTTSPESWSQFYHQFWVSFASPWRDHKNFYSWAKSGYVTVKQKHLGTHVINDYSCGNEQMIMADVKPYMVTMTQAESGFKSKVVEEIVEVEMKPITYQLTKRLLKDLIIEGDEELILADTPAKLQQKCHQLFSGTIKFESGNRKVLDYSKVDYIIDEYGDKKVAIFYKFVAEYQALKDRLGDRLTQDIAEFDSDPYKWIALQIVSGREGTNLSKADLLVMYNIDFSATSYFQARDRMTVQDREENRVVWLFSRGGIEHQIYKAVSKKKSYTLNIFRKDYGIK